MGDGRVVVGRRCRHQVRLHRDHHLFRNQHHGQVDFVRHAESAAIRVCRDGMFDYMFCFVSLVILLEYDSNKINIKLSYRLRKSSKVFFNKPFCTLAYLQHKDVFLHVFNMI